MDIIQEKCDRMIGILTKRNLERKLDIEKDREDKELTNANNEKIDYFERSFAEKRQQIETALNTSYHVKDEDLPAHFNTISKDILTLQKYVAASNIFLRSYDIKICQQTLQDLTNQAKDLEDVLIPKKKFGFRNKRPKEEGKVNGIKIQSDINGKSKRDEVDACAGVNSEFFKNSCGFDLERNKCLLLKGANILKKDVALARLENCKVKLFGSPSTLHMNQLKDCFIFCGPVSTSIFVENCVNCTFVVACQQLRLHGSRNLQIYLHVTSRAIMEDCKQIHMAPYNLHYDDMQKDFEVSGLSSSVNNWTFIDDFNWLNIETKSPNWDVLNEAEQIKDWTGLIEQIV